MPGLDGMAKEVPRELDDFEIGKELGSGHFSRVKLATRKADGMKCAIKIMKKPAPGKKMQFDTEVEIMRRIDHPTIVKLFDVFETEDKVYLVMELCALAFAASPPLCARAPGPSRLTRLGCVTRGACAGCRCAG